MPDVARLAERQLPDPDGAVDIWARRFLAGQGETRTMDMLETMTHAIKAEFRYGARHEEGTQTPTQTLALGSGTCRDFAVLMMEALRSLGLATRFVTGYLYDDTSGTTRGGGSTHAWCGVYLPGAGWVEYDPTNGLIAGANLVRVGMTRTAEQAVPISGGFVGAPDDPIRLDVCVAVSASPIAQEAIAAAE
jgi:transglutaminase-like putative cysteine protease